MNAIEANHLTKAFGARKAVDDVSFALPKGAFLSIFGPNGAGKTTLLNMLSTLSRPSSGNIRIAGVDIKEDPEGIRKRIGYISHSSMLYPDLTAEENLMFYARLYGVEDPRKCVDSLLDAVGLAHRKFDAVRTFSRGMSQRVSIARALVQDPDVVFLDEPYAGLDPHGIEILDGLLRQVRPNHTFVMVSHNLAKGVEMCTHALVMAKGRIVSFSERDSIDLDAFYSLYHEASGMGVA